MQQVVRSKIVGLKWIWNVINQNVLCYTDLLQNNPNRKHLLAAYKPWRYTNACIIWFKTVPRDGENRKSKKRKLQHSRTTFQMQTSTAAFKLHFCAKRFQNERMLLAHASPVARKYIWRSRGWVRWSPRTSEFDPACFLSSICRPSLHRWNIANESRKDPNVRIYRAKWLRPHTITPIETKGEKIEAPPLRKSRAAGGNISGEGQRVRGEAGRKSLTCWEFRQKGGGAGTEETDGEEGDQSDRVARQQHIIKEKVCSSRILERHLWIEQWHFSSVRARLGKAEGRAS